MAQYIYKPEPAVNNNVSNDKDLIQLCDLTNLKTYPTELVQNERSPYVRVRTRANPDRTAVVQKKSLCWSMMKEPVSNLSNDRLRRVQQK